MSSIFDIIYL